MPEYETISAFGSMLGNAHAGSLARANDLCDLLGMDTITMGVTLALVCEAIDDACAGSRVFTDSDYFKGPHVDVHAGGIEGQHRPLDAHGRRLDAGQGLPQSRHGVTEAVARLVIARLAPQQRGELVARVGVTGAVAR